MPVTIEMFEDHENVMIFRAFFPWTVAEWVQALIKSTELSKTHTIEYVIFDTTQGKNIPRDFLSSLQSIRNNYKNQVKRRILVGPNTFIKSMFRVVGAVNPKFTHEFFPVETINQARKLLEEWNKIPQDSP